MKNNLVVDSIPGIIYKTTFINGKIYIGSDRQKDLKQTNPFYLGSFDDVYVYEDLIKCGWNGNDFPYKNKEILFYSDNITHKELLKVEMEFIKRFKSYLLEIGYNKNKFKLNNNNI